MADKKISAAASKGALNAGDMIPVAAPGSALAYHVTGETLFNSIPAASTAGRGTVELATRAEAMAYTDNTRAVTPYALSGRLFLLDTPIELVYLVDAGPTAFADVDLSAHIPAEAEAALLQVSLIDLVGVGLVAFRRDGSSLGSPAVDSISGGEAPAISTPGAVIAARDQIVVGLENRVFEYRLISSATDTATVIVVLLGFYR